ncbi:phage tail tape measure protein [Sphingopyxis yananensis]|uniref:phage tail tape measure protein n=1 Tax=Sphingopyxis yananensis TaxID=2886687 RepID=UPI001D107504|nr:phage tail tape measure protein [Sphingopyxis yananensis]MCC2603031.1 phage tail tape measure protein [Sphingopyxis yananensis]
MSRELRLKFVLDALDRVSGPLQSITGGASKTAAALKATRDQLKSLEAAQAKATGLREQREGLDKTNAALDQARRRQRALRDELAASAAPTKTMQREYDRATKAVEKLEQASAKQADRIGEISREMRDAGINVNRLRDHEQSLASQISRTNQSLEEQQAKLAATESARRKFSKSQELGGKLQGQGAVAIGTGVAASLPAIVAAKSAMSFEDAMADANKVLNLTNEQLAAMRKSTLDQAKRMPLSPQAIMQIKAAGAEMRVAHSELDAFAEDAGKMSVAFGMEAADAGAQMATWRTSFKMNQKEVASLGDQINALTNKMGGNTQAISKIITNVGPLGRVSGVAAGSMAAMAATLDTTGVQADVAGTGIKNMMLALTSGDSATKSQGAAFAELGLNASTMAKRMQKDAGGAITDVLTRISKLSPDKQTAMMKRLFGGESVGALSPMLSNLDDLKARLTMVGDASAYSGSMTDEYLARMGTTSAKMQLAANNVEVLKIQLGDKLLPVIAKAADKVVLLADRFSKFADDNPKLTTTLVLVASAIGPLLIGLGALGIMSGTIIRGCGLLALAWSKLGPVLTYAKAAFSILMTVIRGVSALMITNPIIAIITGIALAVYLIYRNWGTIGPWLAEKWEQVKAIFTGFIGWAKSFFPSSLSDTGRELINGLWSGIMAKKDWLMGKLKGFAQLIPAPIRKALDINSPSRVFADIGGHLMTGLDQGITGGSGAPLSRMAGLSEQLKGAMAAGVVAPALALGASPAMAAGGQAAQGTAMAAAPATYHITINASGSNAQDIADQVRGAIEQIERDKRGRSFGDD